MVKKANEGKAEALALAVAQGDSVAEAADTLGVPRRTAARWSANPRFKDRVSVLRSRIVNQTVGRLARSATRAVDTLTKLLDAPTHDAVRLGAARAILSQLLDVRSAVEIEARLLALEAAARSAGGDTGDRS